MHKVSDLIDEDGVSVSVGDMIDFDGRRLCVHEMWTDGTIFAADDDGDMTEMNIEDIG